MEDEHNDSVVSAFGQDLLLLGVSILPDQIGTFLKNCTSCDGKQGFTSHLDLYQKLSELKKLMIDIIALEKVYVGKLEKLKAFFEEIEAQVITAYQSDQDEDDLIKRLKMDHQLNTLENKIENVRMTVKGIISKSQANFPIYGYENFVSNIQEVKAQEEILRGKNIKSIIELGKYAEDVESQQRYIWKKAQDQFTLIQCKWEYLKTIKTKTREQLDEFEVDLQCRIGEALDDSFSLLQLQESKS